MESMILIWQQLTLSLLHIRAHTDDMASSSSVLYMKHSLY